MSNFPAPRADRSRITCPGLAPGGPGGSPVTVVYSVASMSWINPRLAWERLRLREYDRRGDPGRVVSRPAVIGKEIYRFANLLEVAVTVEGGRIVACEFTKSSGMYRSPSFLNIPSIPHPGRRCLTRVGTGVRAFQMTGCSTQSPQVIGPSGAVLVAKGLTAARRSWQEDSALWAHRDEDFPRWAGCKVAEALFTPPPIWTELDLTIAADGCATGRILRHSLFPSVNFYQQDTGKPVTYSLQWQHDGSADCFDRWLAEGWGPVRPGPAVAVKAFDGNPWGLKRENFCHRPAGPIWEGSCDGHP
jgi:hypothetical protein